MSYYDNVVTYTNDLTKLGSNILYIPDPISTISNYAHETRENQKKETIYLLKPSYLQQFLNDMRTEMVYSESSQFVNKTLIKTENTRVT